MKDFLSKLLGPLENGIIHDDIEYSGISIDSRSLKKGNLFIAIKGGNFNGHDFISAALDNGASSIITEKYYEGIPQIIVKNSLEALGFIAKYHKDQFDPLTISITGTNGKTSVTSLTGSILNKYKRTLTSFGNYNNHIGLPLSILKLTADDKICVLEMGASKMGDITYLSSIAYPNIVALLNVSPAHLDSFNSIENILTTKEEIFCDQGFPKKIIINEDDKYYSRWKKLLAKRDFKTISLKKEADYYVINKDASLITIKSYNHDSFDLHVKPHDMNLISNILFATACSLEAGASPEHVISGYSEHQSVKGRFCIIKGYNNSKIIDDTYNANPASLETSLTSLSRLEGTNYAIIGDMGELGPHADIYHSKIGKFAKDNGIEKLFLLGKFKNITAKGFGSNAITFENHHELIAFIKPLMTPNTNILIKASRFMKFECIVDALISGKY